MFARECTDRGARVCKFARALAVGGRTIRGARSLWTFEDDAAHRRHDEAHLKIYIQIITCLAAMRGANRALLVKYEHRLRANLPRCAQIFCSPT